MMRRRVLRLLTIASMALLPANSGCSSEPSPWVRPRRQTTTAIQASDLVPELRVEFGGCTTVLLGPEPKRELECIYRPGETLRLWVTHEPGIKPEFKMEGDVTWSMAEPYVLPEELGQGYRLVLEERGLKAVTVTLPDRPPWRLALRAVGELSKERRGMIDELTRRFLKLEPQLVKPDLEVLPQIREVLREMVERGQLWPAIKSGAATSFHLTWRAGRPELAQEVLEDLRASIEQKQPLLENTYPFGAAMLSTYTGHALRRRGQLAKAARHYRTGARLARRADDPLSELDALAPYSLALAKLGYFEAAAYWSSEAREIAAEHASAYSLAQTLIMTANVSLRLRQAKQIYDDPTPRLNEVEKIYGPGGSLEEYSEPLDAILSRTELALQNGAYSEALVHLSKDPHSDLPPNHRARIAALHLRILIQLGAHPTQLEQALSELQKLDKHAVGPEARWMSATLAGQVLEASGNVSEAIASYEKAEAILDRLLPLAALGIPGDMTAARLSESSRRLASTFLAANKPDQAMCAIRRARARLGQLVILRRTIDDGSRNILEEPIQNYQQALAEYEDALRNASSLAKPALAKARARTIQRRHQLEEQAFHILYSHGQHPLSIQCGDLTPPAPKELIILIYSEEQNLHVISKRSGKSASHFTLSGYFENIEASDDWKSDLLLQPLREEILELETIRVLSSGRSHSIPFHALPWTRDPHGTQRRPLVQSLPVVYGLDIPSAPPLRDTSRKEALILSDPRADESAREAQKVRARLNTWGWVTTLSTTDSQQPGDIRKELEHSDHFHYAGHAYYGSNRAQTAPSDLLRDDSHRRWPPYSGGAASTPSYLPLGEHGKLTPMDILLMGRAPETVVLMGCKTSVLDERISYGGYSLTSAFFGAGTQTVIASTHDIEGNQAVDLGTSLYYGSSPTHGDDPRRWVTNALNHIERHTLRVPDISRYRTYVR